MYSYIMRRLAFAAVTVIGVSIVVFFVLRVLPGDPLVALFGPEGFTKLSAAERARYMADHLGVTDLRRQMADPAAHEVEDGSARRKMLAVEPSDGGDGRIVDVGDEARRRVEQLVRRLVDAAEQLAR